MGKIRVIDIVSYSYSLELEELENKLWLDPSFPSPFCMFHHIWSQNPESILKHDLDSEEYLGVEYWAQFAQTWLPLGTVVQCECVSHYLQGSDLWNIELGKLR